MSETRSDLGTAYPVTGAQAAPPPTPHLPPRQWVRENLFSSTFNSALTVVAGLLVLAIVRGLLGFVFNPERQWNSTAINMRLIMTHAYPSEQYTRVWVSVGTLLALAGLSLAVWRAGSRIPLRRFGRQVLSTGVGGVLVAVLAPFSGRATVLWLLVSAALIAVGEALRRVRDEERSIGSLTLLLGGCALAAGSLWVVPYGHNSYLGSRDPKILTEPGTVAMTTKLPWTVMLLVVVAAYLVGRLVRDRLPADRARSLLSVAWLLSPLFILYLILRDPDFDLGHVATTDVPIFLAYSILGSVLLLWLTRPETGEVGRIVAAIILLVGFGTFLTPMRMIIRLLMLLLALFALAAPTFSGARLARRRYVRVWVGVTLLVCWLVTAVNTPSTIEVPGEFFIGGFSLTLMVAFFTLVLSFPLGVLLALARTSTMPIFRVLATGFIEFVRGIPLITILIFFSVMVPLFLPAGMDIPEITAVTIGYALFSSAYLAENVRGGLQSVLRGQHEAAEAVGMSTSQKTAFIVLPQALRVAIPPLVGQTIATFKETSLLAIIGLFDLLYVAKAIVPNQVEFFGSTRENLLFVSVIYWMISYSMSKASQRLEQRVGLGER